MARIRSIKPQFFTDDELAEVKPIGRLLFIGLWCMADREGRLEDRPKRIKAEVLPFDNANIGVLLSRLRELGFIQRYEIEGRPYIQITNFQKHQYPNVKEPPSQIPAPDGHHADTVPTPSEHNTLGNGNTVNGNGDQEGKGAVVESAAAFKSYEDCIGSLSAYMAQKLGEDVAEFGETCVVHCLKESAANNKRSLKYAESIMRRHQSEGCFSAPIGATPADVSFFERRYAQIKPTIFFTLDGSRRQGSGQGADEDPGAG